MLGVVYGRYAIVWYGMVVGRGSGRWEGEGVLGKQEPHSGCGELETSNVCRSQQKRGGGRRKEEGEGVLGKQEPHSG